jgi:triacylglycerol lipase
VGKAGAASLGSSLLSIVDSLAHGNLTMAFLSGQFNADTPDDPRVRHFSVAARAPSANVWHPLWLPKLVLDDAEKRARARPPRPRATRAGVHAEWGNDGLVSVQSARWGEFLGTVEGADHGEVRDARGLELELDLAGLQAVSLAIPTPSLPEWDWARWLGSWRRSGAAKQAQDAAAAAAAASQDGGAPAPAKDGKNDGGEKLSAFFDWVAEQVPADPLAHGDTRVTGGAGGTTPADVEVAAQGTKRAGERNELATKDDLARFYVALCRNLYDEGCSSRIQWVGSPTLPRLQVTGFRDRRLELDILAGAAIP